MTVPVVPPVALPTGADVLNELRAALTKYVILPSDADADGITLWIAATHAQQVLEHASRLVVKSPLKRCGKTRALEVISETAHRPLRTTNISTAALVRSIDETDPPTLILDEGDVIFATRRREASEKAEDIRGILNSGHSRGWPYIRWDAVGRRAEECATFAMAAIACIGDLPDTVEDRAVVIRMRRRATGETVAPFRRRRALPELHMLRDRLAEWVSAQREVLAHAEPDVPVEDRAADVWEPLIAIADAAGGTWPDRARRACLALTAAQDDPDDGSAGERLLEDLHTIFADHDALATISLLDALHGIEEAPWGDWFAKPLNARGLAGLLKPYGVRSKQIRLSATTCKGYERRSLEDAWARYRRTSETSETGKHAPSQEVDSGNHIGDDRVSDLAPLGETYPKQPHPPVNLERTPIRAAPVLDVSGVSDHHLDGAAKQWEWVIP